MKPNVAAPVVVFTAAFAMVQTARGHAFLQRYDLPLPLWHYLIGAGLVVAFSFVFLVIFRRDRAVQHAIRIDLSQSILGRALTSRIMRQGLFLISITFFIFLIIAGFFGNQEDPFTNILPVFIWVGWWVGFAFLCILVGNVWPAVNPWTAVARFIGFFVNRGPRPRIPEWVGVWPALFLYLGFAWAELAWPDNAVPKSLAMAILLYSAVTWIGMMRYGTDQWLRSGETFSIIFELFGRFALFAREQDGRLVLRPYGAGLISEGKASNSMVVLIVVLLATVSFDGFLHTPMWREFFGAAFNASYDLGVINVLGNTGTRTLIITLGLIAAPLAFLIVFLAICAVTIALSANPGWTNPFENARLYVLSLLPIAIAYHLAHYLSLLLIEGQRLYALISDPLGMGWNLFGTADIVPDIAVINARFLWLFSVGVIVAGHVVAVWLAHTIALRTNHERNQTILSQIPMMGLMIGYTMLSLWILAQPIVET